MKKMNWKWVVSTLAVAFPCLLLVITFALFPDKIQVKGNMPISTIVLIQAADTLFLMFMHLLVLFMTLKDANNREQSRKIISMVYLIVPVISLVSSGITMKLIMGNEIDATAIMVTFCGLMFIAMGNYFPKCKRNHTIGIRVKWTLESEDNWNATHRFGGKVWVIGGIVALISVFFPISGLLYPAIIVILLVTLIPVIYSYCYYKKQVKAGTFQGEKLPQSSGIAKIVIIVMILTFAFVAVFLEMGSITTEYDENSVNLKFTFWSDSNSPYDEIVSVEWIENYDQGSRDFGYGSFKMGAGSFSNAQFGDYILYAYNDTHCGVGIKTKNSFYVVSLKDETATKSFYEELKNKAN